jgi:protocatechuate 3,4-dioxygenase beta subunit
MTTLLIALVLTAQAADARGGISGRVLVRGENTPVQDARVVVVRIRRAPQPLPPNSVPPAPSPQTVTGPDGSYAFDRLEPGEYGVNVQKTGFAVGPGTPTRATVVVTAGQTVQAPDVFVDRGGAIAGRILDASGEPVTDARVVALAPRSLPPTAAARSSNGPSPLLPSGQSASTNDLGEFRIFGLLPGEYVVAASPQHRPFETGSPSTTLATTYFPGVTAEGSAQRVAVAAGQTTSGIDIRMAAGVAFVVSGVVVTADGQPVEGAAVWLNGPTPTVGGPYLARTDARGRFQIGSVAPGAYRFSVSSSSTAPTKFLLPTSINLTVTDNNVDGVRLVVVPGR